MKNVSLSVALTMFILQLSLLDAVLAAAARQPKSNKATSQFVFNDCGKQCYF